MARVLGFLGFDMGALDLNAFYRNRTTTVFFDDQPERFFGKTYQDQYVILADDDGLAFAGNRLDVEGGVPADGGVAGGTLVSGTVTVAFEVVGASDDPQPRWLLDGISLPAVAVSAAALSRTTRDDVALLRDALAGDDRMALGDQDDAVFGYAGRDRIGGGGGDDRLDGGKGDDRLRGGDGADLLLGAGGNDRLQGGAGADELLGGKGRDRLDAGRDGDADAFVFRAAADSRPGAGRDTLLNFEAGEDLIDLRRLGLDGFGRGPAADAAWAVATDGGVVLRADVSGDAAADFEVVVAGARAVEAGDLLL